MGRSLGNLCLFPVPLLMQAKRIAKFLKWKVGFLFQGKLQAGTNSTLKMIKIPNSDKLLIAGVAVHLFPKLSC